SGRRVPRRRASPRRRRPPPLAGRTAPPPRRRSAAPRFAARREGNCLSEEGLGGIAANPVRRNANVQGSGGSARATAGSPGRRPGLRDQPRLRRDSLPPRRRRRWPADRLPLGRRSQKETDRARAIDEASGLRLVRAFLFGPLARVIRIADLPNIELRVRFRITPHPPSRFARWRPPLQGRR